MNEDPQDAHTPRVQTVRSAWSLALRAEVLRVRTPEMARVAQIGVWLSTYADADGSNAFPSSATLATLAGCSEETVTRAVRVLVAAGVLTRRRRPNKTPLYQLLMPAVSIDWPRHLQLYTETRQKRARLERKRRDIEELTERTPSQDGFRTPSPVGVPEPVPAGGSGTRSARGSEDSEPVPGRGGNPTQDGFRNPFRAGGTYTDLPSVGTPDDDPDAAGPVPQPPVARASPREQTSSPRAKPPPNRGVQSPLLLSVPAGDLAEPEAAQCPECGHPWIPRPGRSACASCTARHRQLDTG